MHMHYSSHCRQVCICIHTVTKTHPRSSSQRAQCRPLSKWCHRNKLTITQSMNKVPQAIPCMWVPRCWRFGHLTCRWSHTHTHTHTHTTHTPHTHIHIHTHRIYMVLANPRRLFYQPRYETHASSRSRAEPCSQHRCRLCHSENPPPHANTHYKASSGAGTEAARPLSLDASLTFWIPTLTAFQRTQRKKHSGFPGCRDWSSWSFVFGYKPYILNTHPQCCSHTHTHTHTHTRTYIHAHLKKQLVWCWKWVLVVFVVSGSSGFRGQWYYWFSWSVVVVVWVVSGSIGMSGQWYKWYHSISKRNLRDAGNELGCIIRCNYVYLCVVVG